MNKINSEMTANSKANLKNQGSDRMKRGWKVVTLGEVCEKGSSNISQNQLKEETGKYPIYGASGFIKNVSFYHNDKPYLSIVKDGSGVGRVTKMDAYTSVIGTLQYIFPKDGIDLNYLYYSLISVDFRKYIAGAAIPHIYFKDYKEEPFLWMPLPEQQRIVSILDEAFAAIAKAKANAEKNLKNARELFESYLEDIFKHNQKGWKRSTVGEISNLYQGLAINSKTKHLLVKKSELPLLRIKDLKNNSQELYIDPINYPKNSLVTENDIIYTRTGSLGMVFRGRKGILHNNSFKVVPNSEIHTDFLYLWLQNPEFKNKILELAQKAAQPDITHSIFKKQEISFPPINMQKGIVENIAHLKLEVNKLESNYQKKVAALEEFKKSILFKTFAGNL